MEPAIDSFGQTIGNRYGPIVFTFKFSELKKYFEDQHLRFHYFRLGTRQYQQERSQVILIDSFWYPRPWFLLEKSTVHELKSLEGPSPYLGDDLKWKWPYPREVGGNSWTHPEFVFSCDVPIEGCTITVEDCQVARENFQPVLASDARTALLALMKLKGISESKLENLGWDEPETSSSSSNSN